MQRSCSHTSTAKTSTRDPDCSPSRWVIDFNERSLDEAERYPRALQRVRQTVKPERDRLDGRNPTATDRARNWWKFGRRSPAMRESDCGPRRSASDYPRQQDSHAGACCCRQGYQAKRRWFSLRTRMPIRRYCRLRFIRCGRSSTAQPLRMLPRYTPSDVFETLPRPNPTRAPGTNRANLERRTPGDHAAP